MPQYRIPELDLSTRCMLGLEMLRPIPERAWGRATELAETYGLVKKQLPDLAVAPILAAGQSVVDE